MLSARGVRTLGLLFTSMIIAGAQTPVAASDGQRDDTFGNHGSVVIGFDGSNSYDDWAQDIAADTSGNVYAVGWLTTPSGDKDWAIARIDGSGNVTTTSLAFNLGGTNDDEANAVLVAGPDRLVVAGTVETGISRELGLCAFNPATLELDTTFGGGGCGALGGGLNTSMAVAGLARARDGGYVVGGSIRLATNNVDFLAVRFDASGALVTSFGSYGIGAATVGFDLTPNGADSAWSMAVDANDEILLAGSAQDPDASRPQDVAIAKLTESGDLDTGFVGTGKLVITTFSPIWATAIAVEPESGTNCLFVAELDNGDGTSQTQLYRISGSGDFLSFAGGSVSWVDTTWNSQAWNEVRKILVQSDGKMIVAGSTAGGVSYEATRINLDGSVDSSFGLNGTDSFVPYDVQLPIGHGLVSATLSAGRLVTLGNVDYSPSADFWVRRLTSDLVFSNGFESGSTRLWSSITP